MFLTEWRNKDRHLRAHAKQFSGNKTRNWRNQSGRGESSIKTRIETQIAQLKCTEVQGKQESEEPV